MSSGARNPSVTPSVVLAEQEYYRTPVIPLDRAYKCELSKVLIVKSVLVLQVAFQWPWKLPNEEIASPLEYSKLLGPNSKTRLHKQTATVLRRKLWYSFFLLTNFADQLFKISRRLNYIYVQLLDYISNVLSVNYAVKET